MKILWCLSLYDENKQCFDKAIIQMGEDDDIHDIQADMAEQMMDVYLEFMEGNDDDESKS